MGRAFGALPRPPPPPQPPPNPDHPGRRAILTRVTLQHSVRRTQSSLIESVRPDMASLLYGSGMRLLECCQLRVKDVDLNRGGRDSNP